MIRHCRVKCSAVEHERCVYLCKLQLNGVQRLIGQHRKSQGKTGCRCLCFSHLFKLIAEVFVFHGAGHVVINIFPIHQQGQIANIGGLLQIGECQRTVSGNLNGVAVHLCGTGITDFRLR